MAPIAAIYLSRLQQARRDRRRPALRVEELEPRVLLTHAAPLAPALLADAGLVRVVDARPPGARAATAALVLTLPGQPGQTVPTTFTLTFRGHRFRDEAGLFRVDDASGRIGTLSPGNRGYAAAALSPARAQALFSRGAAAGASRTVNLPGGSFVGLYVIPDGTSAAFRAHNPADRLRRKPVALFSLAAANPDHRPHLQLLGADRFGFADRVGGRLNFKDLVLGAQIGTPTPPFSGPVSPQPPVVTIDSPTPGLVTSQNVTLTGQVSGGQGGVALLQARVDAGPFAAVPLDAAGHFQFPTALPLDGSADGSHTVRLRATDNAGDVSGLTGFPFTLDTIPPSVQITSPGSGLTTATNIMVTGQVTDAGLGVAVLQEQVDGGPTSPVPFDAAGTFSFTTNLPLDGTADGRHQLQLRATDRAGNTSAAVAVSFALSTQGSPALDTAVTTTLGAATLFLYTGKNPVQVGVVPGTIDMVRAAVLRGKVLAGDGTPLAGVTVTVLDHPEFGSTQTQADGTFSLAVNGGGSLTVNYAKAGFLDVQRQIDVPWQDYTWLPDVMLIPEDKHVTDVNLGASTPIQVAQGSVETDGDGTRQATLFFAAGTQATMVLPSGTTQPLTDLHVRATEYTVGPTGPEQMPGQLPPTSGYTYAVEYSVDEAVVAGATAVQFSQPVISYTQNFLNFPVGMAVPAGSYDRSTGQWIASPNGLVIKVLSAPNGLADLDVDGSGTAASPTALAALGITDAERQQLAALYQPGQSLWRVPIAHFSPWDMNWPYGPPRGALPPHESLPNPDDVTSYDDPSNIIINRQTQTESVPVAGTPFALDFAGDRVPGRTAEDSVEIPLGGATLPPGVQRIDLTVNVAGQHFTQRFPAQPNESFTYTWDGTDAYGRQVQGAQTATITIGYVYEAVYETPAQFKQAFAAYGGAATTDRARQEITLAQTLQATLGIGHWNASADALGGWTLDVHNDYDPNGRTLYLGDGTVLSTQTIPATQLTTLSRLGGQNLIAGPDGSFYFSTTSDTDAPVVKRLAPDGSITVVAGGAGNQDGGDGGPATQAGLTSVSGLALGPDGSLYVAENGSFSNIMGADRIRRVSPDGIISAFAGTGTAGFSGDGGPATQAQLDSPRGLAVGPDGSVYVADFLNQRVRRISPDGIITTVAGNGTMIYSGDGLAGTQTGIGSPLSLAVGPDGSLFIGTGDSMGRVFRLGPDGLLTNYAGNGQSGFSGDGGPAVDAQIGFLIESLAVGPDGTLYMADPENGRVRAVAPDGLITTVAGNGSDPSGSVPANGSPATGSPLFPYAVAVGPDGTLYCFDGLASGPIFRVTPALPGFSLFDKLIPSADGSEVYDFDLTGRHLRTLDALTGATLYSFAYDAAGRLASVTDAGGNVTTIRRDAVGNPTALVAPFGQVTTLTTDAHGFLASIADPAGGTVHMTSTNGGLLTSYTDADGNVSSFTYDSLGRLATDTNAAGGTFTLTAADVPDGHLVTLKLPTGPTIGHENDLLPSGDVRIVHTDSNGLQTVQVIHPDASRTTTDPDGTVTVERLGPDPRFGMLAPVVTSATVTTPGGVTSTTTATRTATLSNPGNPLSLAAQTDTVTVNGQSFTETFNAAAHTVTDTTPAGRTRVTTLDAAGRVTQIQVPGLDALQLGYDAHGRLDSVAQGPRTFGIAYDAQGNVAGLTDPLGHTDQLAFDAAGRVTSLTLRDTSQVGATYDGAGAVASLTPPGDPAYGFTYNGLGLLAGVTAPDAGAGPATTQYGYNTDEQLTQVRNPDGSTVNLSYDSAGRPGTLTFDRGTETAGYNPATGKFQTFTAPDGGTLTLSLDGSLLTGLTATGAVAGSVQLGYDSNFRVASESVNGANPVTFGYDKDGLLTSEGALTLGYDPGNGLLTGTALGGVTDSLGYDPFGEVTGYQATSGGSALYAVQAQYNADGKVTRRTETIGGVTHVFAYGYDADGQLTQVQQDGATVAQYGYDANGNRTRFTGPGGTVTGTYNAQDELLSYGTNTYAYNAEGFLSSKTDTASGQTTAYGHDSLGNLTGVTLPDGTQVTYVIDGTNQRVGTKVNGVLVQGFLYDGGLGPVAELDGNGNVVSRFVYGTRDNVPDYLIEGGVTYRVLTDGVGSVRLVVNAATGQVVQEMDYDAFGNVTRDTNPGFQPFGFAGGLYDARTGLVRFGARDYDPQTGRWTAKDPSGFAGGQANLYVYAGNDPVGERDPSGFNGVTAMFEMLNPSTSDEDRMRAMNTYYHEVILHETPRPPKPVEPKNVTGVPPYVFTPIDPFFSWMWGRGDIANDPNLAKALQQPDLGLPPDNQPPPVSDPAVQVPQPPDPRSIF